jgi:hypothetical protein
VTNFSRKAYSVVSVLLLCEILAQFYLIASAAFTVWLAEDNEKSIATAMEGASHFVFLHAVNGSGLIPLTMLVLIGLSFASRYSWRTTGLTAVLFGLLIVQFSLAAAGLGHLPFVGGFHAVNAVLLVSYAAWTVRRNWAFGSKALARSARATGHVKTGEQPA